MTAEDIKEEGPGEKEILPAEAPKGAAPSPAGASWEADLDSYPLRDPGEDPRWALRTVTIWVCVALGSLAFILTLLVLGAIYD